jgi:hypothetical protein
LHQKRTDFLRFSGYIQAQYQWAQEKGITCYNGGDFETNTDNRFMLRRGRLRFDYLHFSEKNDLAVQFAFQFDGTEKGVGIRDFWGKISEQRFKLFSLTTGMFVRPFGYELNLSSVSRESPERGRMSQILMKGERDLGAMFSFEPLSARHPLKGLKWDLGFFNGQGLAATSDFDSKKDLISRLSLLPIRLTKKLQLSSSVSLLAGGLVQNTSYKLIMQSDSGLNRFIMDSSASNIGSYVPRNYMGGDFQLKYKRKHGMTAEIRAEAIAGVQTSTQFSTETPAALLTGNEAYYVRSFRGAYAYFLYHLVNARHQLVVKFDFYDPNIKVRGREIGDVESNLSVADICFVTWGTGYNYYMNDNTRITIWYDWVRNEFTQLRGYEKDLKDNVFSCRVQFRF